MQCKKRWGHDFTRNKCNNPVLTLGIEIVHDVYIVFKSRYGAQGQGPIIDLVFCV